MKKTLSHGSDEGFALFFAVVVIFLLSVVFAGITGFMEKQSVVFEKNERLLEKKFFEASPESFLRNEREELTNEAF